MSIHRAPTAPQPRDEYEEYDDWDDEEWAEVPPGPRILWGRIAVFATALLLAFVLGRVTAGGDVAESQPEAQRIEELTADLAQARAELDAVQAGGVADGAAPADSDTTTDNDSAPAEQAASDTAAGSADESDAQAAETGDEATQTYTVQPGDYMFGVAEKVYGNGRLWRLIAEANNLGPQAVINPGQELTIPPAP